MNYELGYNGGLMGYTLQQSMLNEDYAGFMVGKLDF